MSKTFRPNEPDQIFLMPASMQDWLPGGHLAYFISDVVDHIDLSVIMERYTGEERGYPSTLPSPDGGEGAPLRLLHRGSFFTEDRKTSL